MDVLDGDHKKFGWWMRDSVLDFWGHVVRWGYDGCAAFGVAGGGGGDGESFARGAAVAFVAACGVAADAES